MLIVISSALLVHSLANFAIFYIVASLKSQFYILKSTLAR